MSTLFSPTVFMDTIVENRFGQNALVFKMLGILIIGFLPTCVLADGGADVVLSCSLVEEGGVLGGMGGGGMFTRTPATLVLRDLAVTPDLSPETLTPFVPNPVPDADDIIIEAKVTSPEIPEADLLLHADCNEQEVTCEISRYYPRGSQDDSEPAYFIGSLQVEGGGLGLTLILQTVAVETDQSDPPALVQSKLELPLSQSGTLLTQVVYLVFSRLQSVSAPLGGVVLLDCGFRQQAPPPGPDLGLEWRLQHQGTGRRILELKVGQTGSEVEPVVYVERQGSVVDAALLVGEGNASVSLSTLKVSDEGTYICTVSTGLFQAQQVIQLHVIQPPRVTLSKDKLVFLDTSPQKLSCHCKHYYPLDAQVEWLSLSPSGTEPVLMVDQGSLSSHRQHSDGTLSISSHLILAPTSLPAGTTVTCRVSHHALASPLSISLTVEAPEPDSYWMFLGFLVITGLFFYQVMR
ncbi:tapasin-related protein isoform X2 [Osmerus mordax]|uniref:tapasin-related protein isoform X2 n=1 Tax=Osmerus mordax TaxID=8014 RepID=UPI00350FA8F5